MPSAAVRDAFKAALVAAYPGAYFDTLNTAPPFLPDEGAGGAAPPIWYTLVWPGSAEQRVSLGGPAACRRETGQAEVWVIAPSGEGDADAITAADAVRELLRDKQLAPDLRTLDADPAIHFTPDDGDYFAAVVAVSYVFEFYH
jgi:hypothetical protein